MGTSATKLLTFEEWSARPETNRIEELIEGELVVTTPRFVHQDVAFEIGGLLRAHAKPRGDRAAGPYGIRTGERTVVEPDVVYFLADNADFDKQEHTVTIVPDLVVEVLSPSNRAHDLVRKRRIFEQFGIPEVWFVDTEALRIEQAILREGAYETLVHEPGDVLEATSVPDLRIDVAEALAPALD